MSTNHQSVVDTLREIEQKAAQVDPETPYDQRDAIPKFYSLCLARRGYGVAVSVLRDWLAEEKHLSQSQATRLIHAAYEAGEIQREGAGSDTRYLTPAYAAEQEAAARAKDERLVSLGARALGLGLVVRYDADRWDNGFGHASAVTRAREGKHLHSVNLYMSLGELVDAMESAGVAL